MSSTGRLEKCPRCGMAEISAHNFCPNCGASLRRVQKTEKQEQKETMRRRRWEWAILLSIVLLTVIGYNIVRQATLHTQPMTQTEEPPLDLSRAPFGQIVQTGHNLMDRGLYHQAIAHYERALEIDSLHPDIIVDLGACYHFVGENEEAELQFHRALAQQPQHPIALFNMGIVRYTVGDTAGVRTWWTRFLEVADAESPQARIVREQLEKL